MIYSPSKAEKDVSEVFLVSLSAPLKIIKEPFQGHFLSLNVTLRNALL